MTDLGQLMLGETNEKLKFIDEDFTKMRQTP